MMNRDDSSHDRVASPATSKILSVIEADRFCERCGYNLRTQAVTRDVRTGILLCRCPECGTFHPAGAATDAGRIWLGRLGTVILLVWVTFLISLSAATLFGMGAIQYGHIEAFTNYNYRQRQVVINGQRRTRQYAERVISLPPSDPFRAERYAYETRLIVGILASLSLAIGLVAGGLFMVFCWHLERPKRVWILFAPLLTGAFVYWIWTNETVDLRDWGLARIGLHAFLQCVGLVLGMRFGRPLTRFGLRFLLPVRLVQHFAFLWLVDGRKIPRAGPDRVE